MTRRNLFAAAAIVASIVLEERIVRVLLESLLRVLGRDRAGALAMAGLAGPAVAAECGFLKELLAILNVTRGRS